MREKVCLTVFAVLVFSYQGLDGQMFNLPTTVLPEKYTLMIYTSLYNPQPMFWGYVYINVHCAAKTSEIILHAKNLQIISHEVRVGLYTEESLALLDVSNVRVVESSDQLIISLKKDLVPDSKYQIYIHYMKNFASDFTEYQMRSYSVDKISIKVAFTKFGSDGAPAVFPCFNNMNFKSRFKVYLAHPKGVEGFSNMPKIRTSEALFFKGWEMDEFKESIPMSTYLVSFALVNVKAKEIIDAERDVAIRVWSLRGSKQIDTAVLMAYKGYKFYSNYFASDYSLPKLDIIAFPKVDDKGNEKYGLLTLSEETILYPNFWIANEEFDVARNMCNVVSHQWIGSFVTMSSRTESWFHEALSNYLEEPCMKQMIKSSQVTDLMDLDVVTKMVNGLTRTELAKLPLSVFTEHENSVTKGFPSSMIPEKAFFLIRMLNFFLGEEVFHENLVTYMKTFGLKNSSLDQVWEIFAAAGEKNDTPPKVTTKYVMDSWINAKTYPVISVRRDFENNVIMVNQEPFTAYMSKDELKSLSSNDCPIIPVNIIKQTFSTEAEKLPFSFWLDCKEVEVRVSDDVKPNEWILLNSHMNVFSRTNYDLKTWRLLQESLLDGKTFAVIDPLTRAHLISDMFVFSRAEISEISYDFALETVRYLRYENKHCVWFVALGELKKIYVDFVGTDLYKPFKRFVREIMTFVFNREEFNKINDLPKINAGKSLKKLIVDTSCLYGVEGCRKHSKLLFLKWYNESIGGKEDALSHIPLAIRDTVLCYGIRKTDQEHWNQLHTEYRKYAESQKTRLTILKALACSKNKQTLKAYLEMSLNPSKIFKKDSDIVFQSLSQNKIGYPLLAEFLRNQYQFIATYRKDDDWILDSYLQILLLSTTRREDLNEVKTFVENIKLEFEGLENLVDNRYTDANLAIAWYERNEPTFRKVLDKFSYKKKSKSKPSSPKSHRSLGGIFTKDKRV